MSSEGKNFEISNLHVHTSLLQESSTVKEYNVTDIFSVNITALDEHEMAQALVGYQPVSIAFEVVSDFMHYKDGVYSSTDCKVRTFILNRPQIFNLVFRMVQKM